MHSRLERQSAEGGRVFDGADIKKLLSRFSHIGVREQTAVNAISALLQQDSIVQVLDPTFLLEAHEWKDLAKEADIEFKFPSKYILCYLIGNNTHYAEQLISVKRTYGIDDIIIIPAAENKSFHVPDSIVYTAAGPKEFVYLIQHAALVCTDSFHATAFSINMNTPHYNLRSRLYSLETDEWTKRITYTPVQTQLTEDRIKSTDFLINSIEH